MCRVGRTGRAGRQGRAVTFFIEDDAPRLQVGSAAVQTCVGYADVHRVCTALHPRGSAACISTVNHHTPVHARAAQRTPSSGAPSLRVTAPACAQAVADCMRRAGCEVPEWMLLLKRGRAKSAPSSVTERQAAEKRARAHKRQIVQQSKVRSPCLRRVWRRIAEWARSCCQWLVQHWM